MTIEGHDGTERNLPSYDVSGVARHRAARVCHVVFGRIRRTGDGPGSERVEKGFIHRPGVVWVGQSVLILPPRDAEELAGKLRALGVRVVHVPVGISPMAFRVFRWPK